MHGMMSCACLAVALLCFALRRYEFLVLNDFKLFSCPAEAAVKRCTARPRRRTTGCQFTPFGPLENDHYTQAKQWDTECWACRGVAPGS